jgi:hypothetical protein
MAGLLDIGDRFKSDAGHDEHAQGCSGGFPSRMHRLEAYATAQRAGLPITGKDFWNTDILGLADMWLTPFLSQSRNHVPFVLGAERQKKPASEGGLSVILDCWIALSLRPYS